MNKSELARDLGLSRQMIYKLIAKGMPCNSVEAARQWRKKRLNPFKTKAYRIRLNEARKALGLR